MKRLLVLFALIAVTGHTLVAQVDRATLTGTILDSNGGVLPGATVTVTNVATTVGRTLTSTETGSFLAVDLIPGAYEIAVELQGYKKSVQTIALEVGQRGRVDVTLEVGAFSETVTVEGTRRLLNLSDATLGSVVPQAQVANLPLAIRNWDDLMVLVPGVQQDRYSEQGGGTSFGRTGGINVHGARALQNNFLLDGVDNNSISENVQELTTQVSRPSVDAIEEFKVVTSPYSAEYGRAPGAAVSVSTKSGTNAFHGTVYDYFRNQAMDSIDFFSKRAGAPKPDNRQNQPGGNLGGPLVKSRAFFFADYEGTRITKGVGRVTRVPTADERNGLFTSAVTDPLTGLPFPGNQIPANRIDPYAAGILGLVPLPNQSGVNNFFRNASLSDDSDRALLRFDWRPNTSDSVFARYIYSNRDRQVPGAFGGVIDGTGTSAFGNQMVKTSGIVGGWTRILSNRLVNDARFSWSRSQSDAVHQAFGLTPPAAAQIPGMITDPLVAGGFPGISVNGYFGGSGLGRLGSPDFLPKFQHTDQFEYLDSLSWLRGNHSFKFGGDIIAPMKNQYQDVPAMRGSMSFTGNFTGNALADYLLGYVAGFQLSNVYVVDQRHWVAMGYVQDDWKVNDRLTLNLGLRYDFITPALEASNRQTNFDPSGSGSLVFASAGTLEQRGLVKPDTNNVGPRVGLVYQLNDQTTLRGGWGMFYNLFDRVGSEDQLALNVPGLVNTALTRTSGSPLFLLQNGIPNNFLQLPNLNPAAGELRSVRIRAVSNDAPKSKFQQASAGLQRELGAGLVLSADFVYTRGSNLATLVNLNQPLPSTPGANDAKGALPYSNFGFIEWRAQNGKSEYHGLDLGVDRRFRDGFSVGFAYTLSKAQDNTSEQLTTQGSNAFPQNARDFSNWYGPSDYDVRHRVNVNFVFSPPGRHAATRNWTLSGVWAARSGRPFTVSQATNNVGTNMFGLPDQTGDAAGPQTVDNWFNAAAFTPVASGVFGNEKRNQLTGPGFQSFDMTVQRAIKTGGHTSLTLRWDVFNLFNTTNFGLPNRNLSGSDVATITSLSGDARTMQLAARVTF